MEFIKFIRDERGDITEKAVAIAVIVLLTIAALRALGGQIAALFNKVANIIASP